MTLSKFYTGSRHRHAIFAVVGLYWLLPLAVLAGKDAPATRPQTIGEFLQTNGRVRVIAHRGFSGRAPENTVAAIRAAIEAGADMAEVDVTLTADGQVVCLHDEKLGRTTDGRGRIDEITLAEALRLDAGSWFSPEYAGELVPTLEAVLVAARGQILLNIEIKPSTVDRGVAAKVVELVCEHRVGEEVVISSFSPEALAQVHALDPALHTISLFNRKLHRGVDPAAVVREVNSVALNINRHYLDRKIMDRCQEQGIPVGVYTANKRRQMERLADRGVHSIFTNHPDLLVEVLAARRSPDPGSAVTGPGD